jgi:hypothetical protein
VLLSRIPASDLSYAGAAACVAVPIVARANKAVPAVAAALPRRLNGIFKTILLVSILKSAWFGTGAVCAKDRRCRSGKLSHACQAVTNVFPLYPRESFFILRFLY